MCRLEWCKWGNDVEANGIIHACEGENRYQLLGFELMKQLKY